MLISVTLDDIQNGLLADSDCCPIALALKRNLKLHLGVHGLSIFIYDKNSLCISEHSFPKRVQKWIIRFDSEERVEPISFRIPDRKIKQWQKDILSN